MKNSGVIRGGRAGYRREVGHKTDDFLIDPIIKGTRLLPHSL